MLALALVVFCIDFPIPFPVIILRIFPHKIMIQRVIVLLCYVFLHIQHMLVLLCIFLLLHSSLLLYVLFLLFQFLSISLMYRHVINCHLFGNIINLRRKGTSVHLFLHLHRLFLVLMFVSFFSAFVLSVKRL